ncbi:MAG: hypothetical protein M1834_000623 [Cirrosporium novae-zelandiae]|nr:MAG: hypothetical protein M1834_000623 [Cirrosporium novae-zelandiae]
MAILTQINDLPASIHISDYTIDDEGNLTLPPDVLSHSPLSDKEKELYLRDNQVLALVLTELCAQNGNGKVYYLRSFYQNVGFWEFPQLLYTTCIWTDEEKEGWEEMGHEKKLHLLDAIEHRKALEHDVFMPIILTISTEEEGPYVPLQHFQLHNQNLIGPATLHITSKDGWLLAKTTEFMKGKIAQPNLCRRGFELLKQLQILYYLDCSGGADRYLVTFLDDPDRRSRHFWSIEEDAEMKYTLKVRKKLQSF